VKVFFPLCMTEGIYAFDILLSVFRFLFFFFGCVLSRGSKGLKKKYHGTKKSFCI
jgi:hypothetical protein